MKWLKVTAGAVMSLGLVSMVPQASCAANGACQGCGEGWVLAREQGLRQLTLSSRDGGVFLGYASPRTEDTYEGLDWSGPEPVPRPTD